MAEQMTAEEARSKFKDGVLEEAAEATGATVPEIVTAVQLHHTQRTARQVNLQQEAQRQQVEWNKENLEFKQASDC